MTRKTLVLAAGLFFALAGSLPGQNPAASPVEAASELAAETGSFGFESQDFWVVASKFVAFFGTWEYVVDGYWQAPGGGAAIQAPVELPAGALVTSISCYYQDDDVTVGNNADIRFLKFTYSNLTNDPDVIPIGDAIASGTHSGYHVGSQAFNETIRYRGGLVRNFYMLSGGLPAGVQFRACRVVWNRQVLAAPVSATFADVPTSHPYFRFVEALSASGITAGCAPSLYCVNNPITRGEMAVFLAVALGLHFPN